MARSNVSIVKGFNSDPAEMRAMDKAAEKLAWMDRHLLVKHRSGKWSDDAMAAIGTKAGINFEMEVVIR